MYTYVRNILVLPNYNSINNQLAWLAFGQAAFTRYCYYIYIYIYINIHLYIHIYIYMYARGYIFTNDRTYG